MTIPARDAHAKLHGGRSSSTLADHASIRNNNFDVLRLFAAALVLFSHSFALVGKGEPKLGPSSLGVVGVEIFFAISGFLVIKSWLSQPRLSAFLVKRGLRIVPALVVALLVSAYILGPLLTDRSFGNYLLSAEPVHHVVDTLVSIVSAGAVSHISYNLPGVFTGNPNGAVNGSLWTLPVEVRAYYLIAALGLVGLLVRWLPGVVTAAMLTVFTLSVGGDWPAVGGTVDRFAGQTESLMLVAIFASSALFYLKRDRIPMSAPLAVTGFVAWLALSWTDFSGVVAILTVPYFILFVAYRSPARWRVVTRHGDVSYGLYLLAFPVQQLVVHVAGAGIGPWELAAVSFPLTYGLAFLSWRFVEAPALRLKGVLASGRRERRGDEVADEQVQAAPAVV